MLHKILPNTQILPDNPACGAPQAAQLPPGTQFTDLDLTTGIEPARTPGPKESRSRSAFARGGYV
jgi:hypothetical protein